MRRHPDRNLKPCSKNILKHREYALASGYDIPGRYKCSAGQNVRTESEYNQKIEFEYIKADGIDKEKIIHKEKTACNKPVTNPIFRRGTGILKNSD